MKYKGLALILCTALIAILQPVPSFAASQGNAQAQTQASRSALPASLAKGRGSPVAINQRLQTRMYRSTLSEAPPSWTGELSMSRSRSLYDLQNGAKYEGMDYKTALSYVSSIGSFATELSVTQTLSPTDSEDTAVLNDSHLAYRHKAFGIFDDERSLQLKWNPSLSVILPLSKKSQKVDQLNTALIAGAHLGAKAGELTSLHGLSSSLSLTVGQFFHRFESDVNGAVLNRLSSNQSLVVQYSRWDWTLSLSSTHKMRWPYSGDLKTSFEFTQDLSYAITKAWSASVGHTNSGSTLKPNGFESNVSILNEDNSMLYLGLSYGFSGA